jgi:hypothetical protein
VRRLEDRERHALGVAQRQPAGGHRLRGELGRHVERDRHRPQRAVGEAQRIAHRCVVVLGHETRERREGTAHQQVQVTGLARREVPAGQGGCAAARLDARGFGDEQVDQGAAVRLDGRAHAHQGGKRARIIGFCRRAR